MSSQPHVVILGAGPAGLGAAYQLARTARARVTVLEANPQVGGNAGSFELAGMRVDYGSHRLHPACDPEVLRDIRALLGDDLLDRPRHGRIRLQGRWIHFPLKPVDLALRLPPAFAAGIGWDMARRPWQRNHRAPEAETFATVLEAGLGRTICRAFYFPYSSKLWGLAPEQLAATQARRRVSAGSPGKMLRKVLAAVPGFKPKGGGRFFYPRRGYGQICEAYARAAREAGADIRLNARVQAVRADDGWQVSYGANGQAAGLSADFVWSTIPITRLAQSLQPSPPPELLAAAADIDYRAMILIYLVLEQDRFSEYDAHYFPEAHIAISRLSEPKNYSNLGEPRGTTVLCAELPCSVQDAHWGATDTALGQLVVGALASAGLPVYAPVRQVVTRRLRQAYPIYRRGYEASLAALEAWLGELPHLLTFGRQGLFAHDNTHHALYMAYAAVKCLEASGRFDGERWQAYRQVFATHVVED
jgi:protoporphyrinogen oxidase